MWAIRALGALAIWVVSAFTSWGAVANGASEVKSVGINGGIELHYVERGRGPTLILIHGSLSDYTYWQDQMSPFAARYHVIAYSRRYNWPNQNPAQPGYSATTDAEDLAGLIATLHLGKVFIVGHSYGALTALFLAAHHPNIVRAVVLAEPPAVSLLEHLTGAQASRGQTMFADIQRRMIAPMREYFAEGDTARGVGAFIDYVFEDPTAWDSMSVTGRAETLRDAHEWDVMMTSGTLFPKIDPETVRAIGVPVLLLSGARSYPFLAMIDEELASLLPDSRRIVFDDSGHQMWLKHPRECRDDTEKFFMQHGGPAPD